MLHAQDERTMRQQLIVSTSIVSSLQRAIKVLGLYMGGRTRKARAARIVTSVLCSVPQGWLAISCRQFNFQTIHHNSPPRQQPPLSTLDRHLSRHPPRHTQPHYLHITTTTTMADKFPSVEDLDSGISLQPKHYPAHATNTL